MNGLTVGQWAAIDAIASTKLPDAHPLMRAIAAELNAARATEDGPPASGVERIETNTYDGQ